MDVRITSFLQQARTSFVRGQDTQTAAQKQQNALLDMVAKQDPQKADVLRGQLNEQQNLLKQLQSTSSEADSTRKENARQKVERLKAQIMALRMMMAGDPKATARRAAQLARELQSAAREYSGNGGGGVIGVPVTAPTANASAATGANAEASAATNVSGVSGVQSGEPATDQAVMVNTVSGSVAPKAQEGDAQADNEDLTTAVTVPSDSGDEVDDSASKGSQIQQAINEIIAEKNKALGESKADADFATEVRGLMATLRIVLKDAKEKLQADGNGSDEDVRQAEKALQETEKELNSLGGLSVNIII